MLATRVPMLDLKAQHDALRSEILQAIQRIVESNQFILGPEVEQFENRLATYCGVSHAIGVSSGTDALLVSLMALGIGPGDEVITTPYSFFATAEVIARAGAKPVFVDIDPDTYNLQPAAIAAAITSRTKAIIPVHLYGQCADMAPILETAQERGLQIVEDAAQAIGAEYKNGKKAGSMGAAGCFSFYPTKNLGGAGDGGAVVTNNAELAEQIRSLRAHGSKPKYHHKFIGGNFRLDAIQAAVLNVKLKHLDQWTRQRQENAGRYNSLFDSAGLTKQAGINTPAAVFKNSPSSKHYHTYHQYVIRAPKRDQLREHLTKAGIDTDIFYPVPFHLQECFRDLGYREGTFPEAERAAKESLALPIYPELTAPQQEAVVEGIRSFYS